MILIKIVKTDIDISIGIKLIPKGVKFNNKVIKGVIEILKQKLSAILSTPSKSSFFGNKKEMKEYPGKNKTNKIPKITLMNVSFNIGIKMNIRPIIASKVTNIMSKLPIFFISISRIYFKNIS
jgi:hypothetical protein